MFMANQHGGQKFIGRNRPPRVQIEVDEECYGSRIKVSLPFVAGVMADLTGHWTEDGESLAKQLKEAKDANNAKEVERLTDAIRARGDIAKREFLEIDQDNFGATMEMIDPTVTLTVPNAITGEGNLGVTLKFRKMTDFEPDALAERIPALKQLLDARRALQQLKNVAGNSPDLEKQLQKVINHPALRQALAAASKQQN